MGWDYIHEDYQAVDPTHYWCKGRWQRIDIELMGKKKCVRLTRPEWSALKRFLNKFEDVRDIPVSSYENLPPRVITVVVDWLRHSGRLED